MQRPATWLPLVAMTTSFVAMASPLPLHQPDPMQREDTTFLTGKFRRIGAREGTFELPHTSVYEPPSNSHLQPYKTITVADNMLKPGLKNIHVFKRKAYSRNPHVPESIASLSPARIALDKIPVIKDPGNLLPANSYDENFAFQGSMQPPQRTNALLDIINTAEETEFLESFADSPPIRSEKKEEEEVVIEDVGSPLDVETSDKLNSNASSQEFVDASEFNEFSTIIDSNNKKAINLTYYNEPDGTLKVTVLPNQDEEPATSDIVNDGSLVSEAILDRETPLQTPEPSLIDGENYSDDKEVVSQTEVYEEETVPKSIEGSASEDNLLDGKISSLRNAPLDADYQFMEPEIEAETLDLLLGLAPNQSFSDFLFQESEFEPNQTFSVDSDGYSKDFTVLDAKNYNEESSTPVNQSLVQTQLHEQAQEIDQSIHLEADTHKREVDTTSNATSIPAAIAPLPGNVTLDSEVEEAVSDLEFTKKNVPLESTSTTSKRVMPTHETTLAPTIVQEGNISSTTLSDVNAVKNTTPIPLAVAPLNDFESISEKSTIGKTTEVPLATVPLQNSESVSSVSITEKNEHVPLAVAPLEHSDSISLDDANKSAANVDQAVEETFVNHGSTSVLASFESEPENTSSQSHQSSVEVVSEQGLVAQEVNSIEIVTENTFEPEEQHFNELDVGSNEQPLSVSNSAFSEKSTIVNTSNEQSTTELHLSGSNHNTLLESNSQEVMKQRSSPLDTTTKSVKENSDSNLETPTSLEVFADEVVEVTTGTPEPDVIVPEVSSPLVTTEEDFDEAVHLDFIQNSHKYEDRVLKILEKDPQVQDAKYNFMMSWNNEAARQGFHILRVGNVYPESGHVYMPDIDHLTETIQRTPDVMQSTIELQAAWLYAKQKLTQNLQDKIDNVSSTNASSDGEQSVDADSESTKESLLANLRQIQSLIPPVRRGDDEQAFHDADLEGAESSSITSEIGSQSAPRVTPLQPLERHAPSRYRNSHPSDSKSGKRKPGSFKPEGLTRPNIPASDRPHHRPASLIP